MRQCAICGKGSIMAGTRKLLRGHYNPTNWSRKYPNLQKAKLPTGKSGLVCTKCLKKLHTSSAPAYAEASAGKPTVPAAPDETPAEV